MTAAVDVLLVGGGIAAALAAAELRERGFDGSILLASREADPPYHRPPITKRYLQGRQERARCAIFPERWWRRNRVDVRTRTPVLALDPAARTAKLGREEVRFEHALLATGAMVRRLSVDGARLGGIHYLRVLDNADALRRDVEAARRVVIVGGSYIATEVAASLTVLGRECTVVMQEGVALERSFGPVVGGWVQRRLEEHGIAFASGETVAAFAGGERVEEVVCESGRRFPADAVVVGVGALPDVMLARKAGLEIGPTGGVRCDSRLRTSAERVWAAGDMCEWESTVPGGRVRVEHEGTSAAQGRTAARNMLGDDVPHADVPYFWSDLADWLSLEYVGAASTWDREVVRGSLEEGRFTLLYLGDGRLRAALTVGRREDLEAARRILAAGGALAARDERLADPDVPLEELAAGAVGSA